ncbi:hypothetical protein [Mycobacterium uberis]|nr:hypothetical protein [Mycobacterium uberis]
MITVDVQNDFYTSDSVPLVSADTLSDAISAYLARHPSYQHIVATKD